MQGLGRNNLRPIRAEVCLALIAQSSNERRCEGEGYVKPPGSLISQYGRGVGPLLELKMLSAFSIALRCQARTVIHH